MRNNLGTGAELEAEQRLRAQLVTQQEDARRGEVQIRFHARLLDAVHEAVIATDLSGKVLYWNRFAETRSAAEALGQTFMDLERA